MGVAIVFLVISPIIVYIPVYFNSCSAFAIALLGDRFFFIYTELSYPRSLGFDAVLNLHLWGFAGVGDH